MHAANHCAIECCYSLFLTSMLASSMASPDALLLVYHHDTLLILYNPAERNLVDLCHETKQATHWSTSSCPSSFILFVKKKSVAALPNCLLCHAVATFIFMLQEGHLNAAVILIPENSCNTEQFNIPR
jgi:hypothetical protein